MQERVFNSMSVKRLGLGEYMEMPYKAERLRELSIKVISDTSIPKNLESFSKIIN